jgi:hypothetical protein
MHEIYIHNGDDGGGAKKIKSQAIFQMTPYISNDTLKTSLRQTSFKIINN